MATIIPNGPGKVAVVVGAEADTAFPMAIDGYVGSLFGPLRSILTNVSGQMNELVQFLDSMGGPSYVYAFGRDVAELDFGGLAFAEGCDVFGGGAGISRLMAYYEANRVGARAQPIQLQIGATAAGRFRGYLTGLHFAIARPDLRVAQFGLRFRVHAAGT